MRNTLHKLAASLSLLALVAVIGNISQPAFAAKPATAPANMHLTPPKADLADVTAVQNILKDLMDASNRHDAQGVLKHYSPDFISGDSLGLKDIRNLILDTWKMFPDIKYESQTLEIRVNGAWATVESIDTATATAKVDPVVSDKPGAMKSRSRGLLYLHRTGKNWEILSDYTLFEKAVITYGPFDTINIDVETPEQVFAGESYTAKVTVGVPTGNIAFATLSQEPLTYPQHTSKDKFRTLSSDKTDLERIFKANATNNNEVVTATVGFTEIGQDDQERPTINLKGIMTVVKRVNVISLSTHKPDNGPAQLTRRTADGKVQVEPQKSNEPDEEDGSGDQPDMDNTPSD